MVKVVPYSALSIKWGRLDIAQTESMLYLSVLWNIARS